MQSITVFVLEKLNAGVLLNNQGLQEHQIVNGVQETLNSQLFVNETLQNNYIHCRVVLDEVIDLQARALNRNLDQVIVQNSYEVYCDHGMNRLICFSDKRSSERIKKLFETCFQLTCNKRIYNLNDVINQASNVKKAQFTNLTIQTINGSVLNGNRVDETDMYDEMNQNGVLSTIAVTYPFGASEVSFSISRSGSIVLFTTLAHQESIDLVEDLNNL